LSDLEWRAIADEAIDAGVVEVAVSGGEPLLRRDLAQELMSRFSNAGVTVNLVTNGWFVDEAFADDVSRLRGLRVLVSLDGATPAMHDLLRGVPGSWRRAVRAIDLLLSHELPLHVNHVVTPTNVDHVEAFLDTMWLLGVRSVRLTPVGRVGAAARDGDWEISERKLRRTVAAARERYGHELRIARAEKVAFEPPDSPPSSMLIRPDGTAMLDSLHPFGFGNVLERGVTGTWKALAGQWDAPAVRKWRAERRRGREKFVPYRDPELSPLTGRPPTDGTGAATEAVRVPEPAPPRSSSGDDGEVVRLALSRRYRVGEISISRAAAGSHLVHVVDRRLALRVNATAALALGARGTEINGETLVRKLAERNPDVPESTLSKDVLALMRRLHARGALVSALSPSPGPPPGSSESDEISLS
jgi:MoaA/NifB/PqqE/SkfB family radical SAM enzyme